MPQDITINGAQYPDVPAVQIPKTGGGTAQFDDTTDATATASEIASGKSAYVNNTRLVGTGQMVEPPLYIDDTINSIGIGEAPTATNYLVNTLNSSFRGQYNNFYSMPYSWSTAGVDNVQGYARIATITARGTAPNLSMPIRFEVFRTYDSKPINMYLRLAFSMDYNPSIEGLYYEPNSDGFYNGTFSAFARKTGTGTYDVYVKKETESSWIGVNTYIPAYMLYRMSVSYANDLYTFVPEDAVMATQMHVDNTSKHNTFTYMPFSFNAIGAASTGGYARIATVNLGTGTVRDEPIRFQVFRRNDTSPVNLYLLFADTYDPTISSFTYDVTPTAGGYTFSAFATKQGTGVWDIYVRKSGSNDSIGVITYIPEYMQDRISVTYSDSIQASVPSGAIMATQARIRNTSNDNQFDYMPYSWRAVGQSNTSGYARIATITFTDASFHNLPIVFEIQQRQLNVRARITAMFHTGNNIDPVLDGFYCDSPQVSAFIYKVSTSVWDVYVLKTMAYDYINVWTYVPWWMTQNTAISYANSLLTSVPSGATVATIAPCYAPTVTLTKSSGDSTASGVKFYRSGNVCHLAFNLATTAQIPIGGNAWVGTSNAPKPVVAATNASYYGSTVIITDFGASGTITVRIDGAALASGSNCYCNVVYLTNE